MASQAETKGSPPDVAADGEDGSSPGNFASIEDLGQISTTNIEERLRGGMLGYILKCTKLGNSTSVKLMETLRACSVEGKIKKEVFVSRFRKVLAESSKEAMTTTMTSKITEKIFSVFDTNGDGYVDSKEFLTGMTVLAGNDTAEKLKSTFQLFDLNGDGMINLEELSTYLASFFRVMAALDGQFCSRFVLTDGSISTPKEIATATAKNAFMSADLNKDGKLSFDEFCKWYRGPAISFCSVKE